MDSLITAAARALATGDVLGALNRVALRDDPPAIALRGIAMARLGDYELARRLLRRAARAFGPQDERARARCVIAEAEVALAVRELGGGGRALAAAIETLERHADHLNAAQAWLIEARRCLLLGRLGDAGRALSRSRIRGLPPTHTAVAELIAAELAQRALRVHEASVAIDRAREAAGRAGIPALLAEAAKAREVLNQPAARCLTADGEASLLLADVVSLMDSDTLIVDACRRGVRAASIWRPLTRRPVLFALSRSLATAWPGDVDRQTLIQSAFGVSTSDESYRARLRVEIGRLRRVMADLAEIEATEAGFALRPGHGRPVVVLAPPIEGSHASLRALLADGLPWSTSALALAVRGSQRAVQRALGELQVAGLVRSTGRTRARRWLAPSVSGFATILLLPAVLPGE
ncbi:MAG: helix-turn-helix domain-containing protein [Betaproteobacteria bacterium]|nr:helix-turn-helix domain-containing protein [Betaproteobacteria bacterium]